MDGIRDFIGTGHGPVSKKLAVKSNLIGGIALQIIGLIILSLDIVYSKIWLSLLLARLLYLDVSSNFVKQQSINSSQTCKKFLFYFHI